MIAWRITVTDSAQERVLFVGNSKDRDEIEAVAAEAARLRPDAVIILSPPLGGRPYVWTK